MRRPTFGRSAALARLCQSDILSPAKERQLFSQLKMARRTRRTLGNEGARAAEAVAIRNQIVECNLRLVVSLAKRFATRDGTDCTVEELVSEGILSLIRCVDSFDGARGTRFSTYATRALTNHFVRIRRAHLRRRYLAAIATQSEPSRQMPRTEGLDRLIQQETLGRVKARLAELPSRDRAFVALRFGLNGDQRPRTFLEMGKAHGLSKERVRVITSHALERLVQALDEGGP